MHLAELLATKPPDAIGEFYPLLECIATPEPSILRQGLYVELCCCVTDYVCITNIEQSSDVHQVYVWRETTWITILVSMYDMVMQASTSACESYTMLEQAIKLTQS